MLGKALSASLCGISASVVSVEADVSSGIPYFDIIGNLSGNTREGRDRVKNAIRNAGFRLPPSKIVVNMAPAEVRKDGTQYDLAVAIAVLTAYGVLAEVFSEFMYIGELSLSGEVYAVSGVLPMVIGAVEEGIKRCFVPKANLYEAMNVPGIEIIGVETLKECVDYLCGDKEIEIAQNNTDECEDTTQLDFADIKGQTALKRAALIAACGMHNMLVIGPPGTGKSMAAMRIPGILPPLSFKERLEISKLYSISGLLDNENCLVKSRPYRSPHYTVTRSAFCGGGRRAMPGEISLAGSGVLFLDEINLFSNEVVDTLREPLETGRIRIDRQSASCEYNADMMLVAAMNPCRCGFYPDRSRCNCTEAEVNQFFGKVSKPVLDRIDIFVNAARVSYEEINNESEQEYTNENMKKTVKRVWEIQRQRYELESFDMNSHISTERLGEYCTMESDAQNLLKQAYERYNLSVRSYNKIRKVARTIADIEGHELITEADIFEAIGYKAVIDNG